MAAGSNYQKVFSQALPVMVALLGLACGGRADVAPAAVPLLVVELKPAELDDKDSERRNFGKMQLMSAHELRSRDRRFGGLSGLSIGADGFLYAVSDRGFWISAQMVLSANGQLADLTDWRIEPLLTPQGAAVAGAWTDAEALTRTADGSFIVAFEQKHRLWRYPRPRKTFSSAATTIPLPEAISPAPINGGMECLAALPEDRLITLTEELKNPDGSFAGWVQENGRFERLAYSPASGYRVADCAALRNGDLIVLERRFSLLTLWGARLAIVPAQQLRGGAKLEGFELLRLESPLSLDNFEGVAVQETDQGTMVYMVSDDNYHSLQRTLIYQFLLPKLDAPGPEQ